MHYYARVDRLPVTGIFKVFYFSYTKAISRISTLLFHLHLMLYNLCETR